MEWHSAIQSGPLGPGYAKIVAAAAPQLRLALPNQRSRCGSRRRGDPCGRPIAFPFRGGWLAAGQTDEGNGPSYESGPFQPQGRTVCACGPPRSSAPTAKPEDYPISQGRVPSPARPRGFLPLVGAAISRPSQTASYLRSGRSGTGPCGVHRTGFCIFVGAAHRAARKRPDGGIGPYKRSNAPPDTP